MMMNVKKCFKCGIEKPTKLFGINRRNKDGFNPRCKDCESHKRAIVQPIVNLINEEWRDVPGYEGLYQVSNMLRVKSAPALYYSNGGEFMRPEKLKSQSLHHNGYFVTTLTKNGKRKSIEVHRLLALAFIPNPDGKPEVNHKNYNRSDNRIENLEWVSIRENVSHGRQHSKTHSKYTGVSFNKRSKKWMAYCSVGGKLIHLGATYKTEEEAAIKYNEKLEEMGISNIYKNNLKSCNSLQD